MAYNIDFDISSLFIFAILIAFYFRRKNLPIIQNRTYIKFLVVAFFATVFDVFTVVLLYKPMDWPNWIVWITNLLCFLFSNTLPFLYAVYCCSLVDFEDLLSKRARKHFRMVMIIPFIIQILMIVAIPISYYLFNNPFIFYIDEFNIYHRTESSFYLVYILIAYYTIVSALILFRRRKAIRTLKLVLVCLYIVFVISSVLVQMVFPNYLVQNFGVCLTVILFSILVQSPEEYLDRVTNIYNQSAFVKMTRHYLKQNNKILIISIILDDTLFISNAFGLNHMNSFLKIVAKFLSDTFGHAEQYYLSQGKFALLFKEYNPRDIEKYIFEIRARFHEPWFSESLELKLYSRVCVIECPKDSRTSENIIDIIDMVCEDTRYKRSIVYARDIDTDYMKHTALIAHLLRNALTEKRFSVYYQPIYSTTKKRIIGAEALIRMKDFDGNFVSPEEFIPISERTGDILRIGQFVFETVCETLASIDVRKYGIEKIDINLSVAQCMQEILAEQILTICTIHRIPSSIINMEITETAAAHTPDILLKNMNRLAEEGIELSLDDYGSGYSNMNYLLNFPFKMVKIDKYIVWSAFENKKAEIALSSTIQMIKKLGMTVLAEGVETQAQKEWLEKMGCDYLQGFYFAKGIPEEEFLEMMKNQNEKFINYGKDSKEDVGDLESI